MKPSRTLLNVLFASVGYVVIRLVIAPARIKLLTALLTKEDYGLLSLIMLTVSFITLVGSLGSFEYMLRRNPGRSSAYQMQVLRTVVTCFGGLAIVIAVIGVGLLGAVGATATGLPPNALLACALILVLTVHLTQLVYFLIGRSQYAQSRFLMLLHTDAWFLPLLAFMWFVRISVPFMLWLWVAWLIVSLCISQRFVRTRAILRAAVSRESLRDILRFGLPLMPMIMGDWLIQMQYRYVLLAFTDLEAVANFSLCFNIAWMGVATGASMLDILITEFYKARNRVASTDLEDLLRDPPLRAAFTMMLRYALALSIPVVLVIWFARLPLILLLSDPKFADAAPIMPWVAPLPLLYVMVLITGRALLAMERGAFVGKATLAATGIHLILSIILTPLLRERGPALAGCVAYGLLWLCLGRRAQLWRWIVWSDLRPLRMAVFALITGAGIVLGVTILDGHHLAALAVGGIVSLAGLVGLGLISKRDVLQLMASMRATGDQSATPTPSPITRK